MQTFINEGLQEREGHNLVPGIYFPSTKGKIKKEGQTVDALALGGDEGRDKLR